MRSQTETRTKTNGEKTHDRILDWTGTCYVGVKISHQPLVLKTRFNLRLFLGLPSTRVESNP